MYSGQSLTCAVLSHLIWYVGRGVEAETGGDEKRL